MSGGAVLPVGTLAVTEEATAASTHTAIDIAREVSSDHVMPSHFDAATGPLTATPVRLLGLTEYDR